MPDTRREAAERIVRETMLVVPGKIADRYIAAIEAELKARDERAAKIVNDARFERRARLALAGPSDKGRKL